MMTANANEPLRLYLVRHGQTEWSLTGQHTGRKDIPLTAQGQEEALAVAPLLQKVDFSHVFSSPLQRARHTCALAGYDERSQVLDDLAEWDYGDYEGLRSGEIRELQRGWNIFIDGCPQGESAEQITDRVDRLIAYLHTLSGNIALFAHGHVGCVLAARWLGLPVTAARHLPLATASLSVLGLDAKHGNAPILCAWNLTPGRGPLEGFTLV